MMEKPQNIVHIDYSNIFKYIEDRAPYIFVDKVDVIPGESASGVKNFTYNEWFFKCHLENNPIVPAAFMLESITQAAGLAIQVLEDPQVGTTIYVKKYKNIEVFQSVHPGDQLFIEAKILKFRRGIIDACGTTSIIKNDEKIITCSAEFQMIAPCVFKSLSPQNISEEKC